jgi:signal transduction histidine kinase
LQQSVKDERSLGFLATAQKELGRVAHIARQTLAFYREATNPAMVDLCELVREILEVYGVKLKSSNLEVRLELDCVAKKMGYAGELRQVISNLLANAIDASAAGEIVRIRVREARDWSHPERKGIRLSVADHGRGIPPALRSEIFKPFVTSKGEKGTGLGLWVTASIVEKHGGVLRFRSHTDAERHGTCFSLFLPFSDPSPAFSGGAAASLLRDVGAELLRG